MNMKIAVIAFVAFAFTSYAVPVRWEVDAARVQPVVVEAYHGETLQLEAQLPEATGAANASLLWQTNGMGSAWWSTNASCSAGGLVTATFHPGMDPGASRVAFFLGVRSAAGVSYRASGTIVFRPSPGADPTTAALPPPGGTLDLSSIQVVNAPWATLEAVQGAVESATNALAASIPTPPDLSGYALSSDVDARIAAATNAIPRPEMPDLEPYCTVEAAEAMVSAASNSLAEAISGIQVPSFDGYATEAYVQSAIGAIQQPDLSPYATRTYADAAASNAVAGVQVPSLEGYATESYVQSAIGAIQQPDLSSYATRTYADEAASNAVAGVQVPSLEGYATEAFVQAAIGDIQQPDLSPYATRSYADEAEARAMDFARSLSWASAGTNGATRLWRPDASGYIDGLGDVYDVQTTVVTNYHAASNNTEWAYMGSAASAIDPEVTVDTWQSVGTYTDNAGHIGVGVLERFDDDDVPGAFKFAAYVKYFSGWASYAYAVARTNETFGCSVGSVDWYERFEARIASTRIPVYRTRVVFSNEMSSGGAPAMSASQIADGTNIIDAAGRVWRVEANSGNEWRLVSGDESAVNVWPFWGDAYDDGNVGWWIGMDGFSPGLVSEDIGATSLSMQGQLSGIVCTFERIPPITTNLVGRVALTNDVPSAPGDIGAAPASVADTVQAWQTYWDGDDVRVTVTNYYGSLDIPHLYIEQKMQPDETHDAAWFKTIWDEMTRWDAFLGGYAVLTNHVENDLADRAWGYYDSHTGEYAPDGCTQISSSNIVIAAGMGYHCIDSDGDTWVLASSEPFVFNVETNGFFRISDGDGNALVEIVKGDKRAVGANAAGISKVGNVVYIPYNVVADEHPALEMCTDIGSPSWSVPTSVVWSGSSGAYVAAVDCTGLTKAFFRATYQLGAETYVKNHAPVGIERVYIGGRSYRVTVETVNGKKLMVLTDD